jgi:hypothetical protein
MKEHAWNERRQWWTIASGQREGGEAHMAERRGKDSLCEAYQALVRILGFTLNH